MRKYLCTAGSGAGRDRGAACACRKYRTAMRRWSLRVLRQSLGLVLDGTSTCWLPPASAAFKIPSRTPSGEPGTATQLGVLQRSVRQPKADPTGSTPLGLAVRGLE